MKSKVIEIVKACDISPVAIFVLFAALGALYFSTLGDPSHPSHFWLSVVYLIFDVLSDAQASLEVTSPVSEPLFSHDIPGHPDFRELR